MGRSDEPGSHRDALITGLRDVLLLAGFLGLLLAVFLTQRRPAPPPGFEDIRIATGIVIFGLSAMGAHMLLADEEAVNPSFFVILLAGLGLLAVMGRYRGEDFPPGAPSILLLVVILILLFTFVVAYPDFQRYTSAEWVAIGSLFVVIALFLFHTRPVYASGSPTWPVWAVVAAGVNVVAIPRFVPTRIYLWAVGILAAFPSAAAILARVYGEYMVWGFQVTRRNVAIPFFFSEPDFWYTIMPAFDTNVFGLIAFAGLSVSVFLLHRGWRRRRYLGLGIAMFLTAINAIGLLLSSSDASWIAAAVTIGCFLAFLVLGRAATAALLVAGAMSGMLGAASVYAGVLPIDAGGRFDRWRSGIRVFRADPTWFGLGHVSTANVTAPYLEAMDPGPPHNSYLDILLRTGIVGLMAYLILIVGAIVDGVRRADTVDDAMLAFAIGWAVHHIFESYSIIQTTIPAVLSALTIGYLVFGARGPP